jgi:hypothetical protein
MILLEATSAKDAKDKLEEIVNLFNKSKISGKKNLIL